MKDILFQMVKHHSNFKFKENSIYCGDCKEVLRHFPDECVDLIYIDPPFFTNKSYEVIWNDGSEIRSFEDRWRGGKNHYISWLDARVRECHRVLKKTGSMYVHCDWHANHYIRSMMDKIFGENNFRNEIIWSYGARGGKANSNQFGRTHDNIFYYVKSSDALFNKIYNDFKVHITEATKYGYKQDEKGRWFKSAPANTHTKKRITELEKEDRIYYTKNGKPRVKYFLKTHGEYIIDKKMIGSVWTDIPDMMHTSPSERMGYPTQKPEALLERIIEASSNVGDLVLDCFCGCGTTIAVASRLNRKWIGIDVSPTACRLMATQRMHRIMNPTIQEFKNVPKNGIVIEMIDLFGYPINIDQLKSLNPFEFENIICDVMHAKQTRKSHDMGIDALDENGNPIQIKKSERIGRNVIDSFKSAIQRENKKFGTIVGFSFTKGAYDEVARLKQEDGIDIKLSVVSVGNDNKIILL